MASYNVSLVAATGREQAVQLKVAKDGLRLQTQAGKDLEKFPYQCIIKWLPADKRSRHPGSSDCLDIQIETTKGPRDLRVRCSSAAVVKTIIKQLREVVEGIMAEYQSGKSDASGTKGDDNQTRSGTSPAGTGSGGPTRSTEAGQADQAGARKAGSVASHISQEIVDFTTTPMASRMNTMDSSVNPMLRGSMGGVIGEDGAGLGVGRMASEASSLSPSRVHSQVQHHQQHHPSFLSRVADRLNGSPGASHLPYGLSPPSPTDSRGQQSLHRSGSPGARPPALHTHFQFDPSMAPDGGAGSSQVSLNPARMLPSPLGHMPARQLDFNQSQAGHQPSSPGAGPSYPAYGAYQGQGPFRDDPYMGQGHQDPYWQAARPASSPPEMAHSPPLRTASISSPALRTASVGSPHPTRGFSPGWGQQPWAPPVMRTLQRGLMGASFPPMGPVRSTSATRESEIQPPKTRKIDLTQLGIPAAAATGLSDTVVADYKTQIKFLEDMVRRLSEELARSALDPNAPRAKTAPGSDEDGTPLLDSEGLPLPEWLKDQRYLNPLIAAYDGRIAKLEGEVSEKVVQLEQLRQQVNEVVNENEKLRGDLMGAMETLERRTTAEAAIRDSSAPEVYERLDLLQQENDLLVQQQEELEREIQRLQSQLESRTSDNLRLAQEAATLTQRMHQQKNSTTDMESKSSRTKSSLKSVQDRCKSLEEEVARYKAALDEERSNLTAAQRTLHDAARQHQALATDLASIQAAHRASADASAAMQAEVNSMRERCAASNSEAAAARHDAESVRQALSSVETRLREYQRKDAEVYSRIREAMEMAEEAKLAREAAMARQRELEREVSSLQQRLASHGTRAKESATAEFEMQLSSLRSELAAKDQEVRQLESRSAEQRAEVDRSRRERASLEAELAALKADVGDALTSKSRISILSLGAVEKLAEMERHRDDALQRLESVQRAAQRGQREWELERQKYESELRELRKRVGDAETLGLNSRTEALSHSRQVEALARELAQLRQAAMQQDEEVRARLGAVQAERDAEVRSLASKLEAALLKCNESVAQAEQLLNEKEARIRTWQEEAQRVASRLDRALAEHRKEVEAQAAELAATRNRCDALAGENMALAQELDAVRGRDGGMQAALDDAELRAAQAQAQLVASSAREEELEQDVRALSMQLDRAKLERGRLERARQALSSKFESVMRQSRALQEAGVAGAVPTPVHSHRPRSASAELGHMSPVASSKGLGVGGSHTPRRKVQMQGSM